MKGIVTYHKIYSLSPYVHPTINFYNSKLKGLYNDGGWIKSTVEVACHQKKHFNLPFLILKIRYLAVSEFSFILQCKISARLMGYVYNKISMQACTRMSVCTKVQTATVARE